MAAVYFDASALVKLLRDEAGSDAARLLWDGCDVALSNRLTYPEVAAALAAAARDGRLTRSSHDQAVTAFDAMWGGVRPVELTDAVARAAGRHARQLALRGSDAVHVASAAAIGDPGLLVASWDRRLSAACSAAGLSVVGG